MLRCEGPDAESFLQSLLSSDVATLQPGSAQWSAWLNAKGRVVALILLFRHESQSFDLLLPDHPADSLAAELSRFVLRRKARLSTLSDAHIIGGIHTLPPDRAVRFAGMDRRWIEVRHNEEPRTHAALDPIWKRLDLLAGVPRLDAEGGSHTAHMLGLDRLQAISLSKGCYPGQEIVARTHYLGQSKRGIACLYAADGAPPARGSAVLRDGQAVGEVLDAAPVDAGGCLVQAVASALQPGSVYDCGTTRAEAVALAEPPIPLA
ncbi:YgfZ/GcvT domain-containing protein [Aquimonas voraii]|uniref:CAF17-like 4Fe-4S cluster assembly/insertion protein YgfZ n=1 Tax=Aquimonas voraii TaxID=265719 RepID=UPI00159FE145|nr:folate-binding protein YgfZ [Aquimonas voraii]